MTKLSLVKSFIQWPESLVSTVLILVMQAIILLLY